MKQRNFQMIKTNGVTLRTVVEGSGPLVILLHGFPQCWYLWRHQIDPLVSSGFQVAVPDQRGYGGSDRPSPIESYNIVELSNDVAGLATALGHERFIVVGHDWGAPVAYRTASSQAGACRGRDVRAVCTRTDRHNDAAGKFR
jgi:pimeloyl-ACP methyl ester carboxylesterase